MNVDNAIKCCNKPALKKYVRRMVGAKVLRLQNNYHTFTTNYTLFEQMYHI